MRTELIRLYERDLLKAIGGQLFAQSPNGYPRKSETIMKKVRDNFRKEAINDNFHFRMNIPTDELYVYIDRLLKSIPEFEELNLSHNEYYNGVKVHDEDRPSFGFVSSYDVETEESWKDDFVDLDAFVRNVCSNINMIMNYETDCFCCIHNGKEDSEACKTCVYNINYTNNYESDRTPKGKYTFACKYDCPNGYYIGCNECDKKEDCKFRCKESCRGCSLAINYKKIK